MGVADDTTAIVGVSAAGTDIGIDETILDGNRFGAEQVAYETT